MRFQNTAKFLEFLMMKTKLLTELCTVQATETYNITDYAKVHGSALR